MGNVIKIIVSFSERFWDEDLYDVVCTESFVPEFWMLRYPARDYVGVEKARGAKGEPRADAACTSNRLTCMHDMWGVQW